ESGNEPPLVDAGPDQQAFLTPITHLEGSAYDDILPPADNLTKAWSVVSGPGTVTFGDAAKPVTTATFSAPGVYVLRLTADDGALSSSDDVQFTVANASEVTSLTMRSERGDDVGLGQSYLYTQDDGTFYANANENGGGASIFFATPNYQ